MLIVNTLPVADICCTPHCLQLTALSVADSKCITIANNVLLLADSYCTAYC